MFPIIWRFVLPNFIEVKLNHEFESSITHVRFGKYEMKSTQTHTPIHPYIHTNIFCVLIFYALAQRKGYNPKGNEILSWTMRGLNSRRLDRSNIASCQLFSTFFHAIEIVPINTVPLAGPRRPWLENWQPVWNKQILISKPLCYFRTAPWLWW